MNVIWPTTHTPYLSTLQPPLETIKTHILFPLFSLDSRTWFHPGCFPTWESFSNLIFLGWVGVSIWVGVCLGPFGVRPKNTVYIQRKLLSIGRWRKSEHTWCPRLNMMYSPGLLVLVFSINFSSGLTVVGTFRTVFVFVVRPLYRLGTRVLEVSLFEGLLFKW